MPEVVICRGCKKRVDVEDEEFVVPNKSDPEPLWEYFHYECWEKKNR